jgi:hypothetical protein
MDELRARLDLGRQKYGHGVRVHMDTTTWGTPKNSWLEMAKEEFLDGIIYVAADYIKEYMDISKLENADQNELILHCIETRKYTMIKSLKHKQMIDNLFIMIDQC